MSTAWYYQYFNYTITPVDSPWPSTTSTTTHTAHFYTLLLTALNFAQNLLSFFTVHGQRPSSNHHSEKRLVDKQIVQLCLQRPIYNSAQFRQLLFQSPVPDLVLKESNKKGPFFSLLMKPLFLRYLLCICSHFPFNCQLARYRANILLPISAVRLSCSVATVHNTFQSIRIFTIYGLEFCFNLYPNQFPNGISSDTFLMHC